LLFAIACSSKPGSPDTSSPKFKQYYVQGEKLYTKYCSNCHQAEGTGLARVYPPLNKSDFMDAHFNDVVCLIRYGIEGELVVNGIQFNQPMKGIPALSDLEIAEITTYIYNAWEHQKGITEVREVTSILNSCNSKP
jgi:mono/diheme cytochrome c family protein